MWSSISVTHYIFLSRNQRYGKTCFEDKRHQKIKGINQLENNFKNKENGSIRPSQFMGRKQQEGESFTHFDREKLELLQLSDTCSNGYERCLADYLIEWDAELRKKCRILPESSNIKEFKNLCENNEAAREEHTVLRIFSKFRTKTENVQDVQTIGIKT